MKPHVVFVVLDDLGSYDLGYHGSGISTPNVDALIKEGIYLDNYYTFSSCTQTRIAFMTGKYPYASGVYDVVRPQSQYGMPMDTPTLAQVLKSGAGFGWTPYRTAATGKWHLGNAMYEQTPTYRGFESFLGFYRP